MIIQKIIIIIISVTIIIIVIISEFCETYGYVIFTVFLYGVGVCFPVCTRLSIQYACQGRRIT